MSATLRRLAPSVLNQGARAPACGIRALPLQGSFATQTPISSFHARRCSTEAVDGDAVESKLTDLPDLNDPERPEENRLARMQMWHAALWWHWEHEGRMLWDRMDKVTEDKLFLLTAHTFAKNGTKPADELFAKLEEKFLPLIPQLSPRELAILGRSFAQHKGEKGSSTFWDAVVARATDSAAGSFSRGQAAELMLAAEKVGRPLQQKLSIA